MDKKSPDVAKNPSNNNENFCGKVPLNQTNLVQPHGVLLVLRRTDLTVLQCSENVAPFFGVEAQLLVNTSLASYISPEQFDRMKARLEQNLPGKVPICFRIGEQDLLAVFESQQDYFIAEVEKVPKEQEPFLEVYQDLKFSMATIDSGTTTAETCKLIATELKKLSGFDKVMIYRFDKDWNGEVIAEVMEEGMESYYGLKFPASDVPRQARELYKISPYRLIPDTDYDPIRLYPVLNPLRHTFTDLSNCNLRSVASVHLEYLRNMKVRASMSTRILKEGELWGLVACHHRTPKFLSYQTCSVFELLSTFVSAKITAMENIETQRRRENGHQLLVQVLEGVYRLSDLREGLMAKAGDLKAVLNAHGVALMLDKQVTTFGVTPEPAQLRELIFYLQMHGGSQTFQVPSLSAAYEPAEDYSQQGSGVLVLPLQPGKGDYILAFRPEEVQEVTWGGNPNEALRFEADGKTYHPRSSFSQWSQTVLKTAREWTADELEIAEKLRSSAIDFLLGKKSQ